MNPKLSVCMPVYNQERYLREAIESVLAQTYRDFELIIADDHSSDASARIALEFSDSDPRIKVQKNETNIGMVRNWNLCLLSARGEYIKYLFGDDALCSPSALSEMVALLESDPSVSLVAAARHIIDDASRISKTVSWYRGGNKYSGSDIIRDCILEQKNRIGEPSAVMFRKKHATRGFDTRYRQIVDLEMWFHLLEQGTLAYIDRPLVAFRVHSDQQTRHNLQDISLIDEPFLLLDDYASKQYLGLSGFKKRYMKFVPLYGIWKLYKKHKRISRKEALECIKSKSTFGQFIFFYPWFKLYKFFLNTMEKLSAKTVKKRQVRPV